MIEKKREFMVELNKTLCKQCKECEDYTYERINRKGELITFQYCKGGKEEVELSNWYIQKDGYAYSTKKIDGKKRLYHTLFKKDETKIIDHIDGFRNDNRLRKLREITPLCNTQNLHLHATTSKFPGVYWNNKLKKWISSTRIGNKKYNSNYKFFNLGSFDSEEEAYHAYVTHLKKQGRTVNTQVKAYDDYLEWLDNRRQTTLV